MPRGALAGPVIREGVWCGLWSLGLAVKVPLCSAPEGTELGGAQRLGMDPTPWRIGRLCGFGQSFQLSVCNLPSYELQATVAALLSSGGIGQIREKNMWERLSGAGKS